MKSLLAPSLTHATFYALLYLWFAVSRSMIFQHASRMVANSIMVFPLLPHASIDIAFSELQKPAKKLCLVQNLLYANRHTLTQASLTLFLPTCFDTIYEQQMLLLNLFRNIVHISFKVLTLHFSPPPQPYMEFTLFILLCCVCMFENLQNSVLNSQKFTQWFSWLSFGYASDEFLEISLKSIWSSLWWCR